LLNGLTNAVKFTKAGCIAINLSSSSDNAKIVLQIRDTGPGIDPKFSAKIFEPFTKASSFTPGAGLGLNITKSLAERMGGSVSLTSLPIRGALFEAQLPVQLLAAYPKNPQVTRHIIGRTPLPVPAGVEAVSQPIAEISINGDAIMGAEPLRILVADDNEIGRKILVTLLERLQKAEPLEIVQACDGLEC